MALTNVIKRTLLCSYARLTSELPSLDATPLFHGASLEEFEKQAAQKSPCVHMTAVNANVGKTHYNELDLFIRANQNHKFYFWSDHECVKFINKYFSGTNVELFFQSVPHGIVRADLFRMCILFIYGGIYFDLKSRFNSKLDLLNLDNGEGFVIEEPHQVAVAIKSSKRFLPSDNIIANWFLAFPAKHPFLLIAIERLTQSIPKYLSNDNLQFSEWVWETSGPRFLTRVLNENWTPQLHVNIIKWASPLHQPVYACKGSWVRTCIRKHYSQL